MSSTNPHQLLRTGAAAKALGLSRTQLVRLIRSAGLVPAETSTGGHQYWDIEVLRGAYLNPDLATQHDSAPVPAVARKAAAVPAVAWLPDNSRSAADLGRAAEKLGVLVDLGFTTRLAAIKFPSREIALLQAISDPERPYRALVAPASAAEHTYWPLVHRTCLSAGIPLLLLP